MPPLTYDSPAQEWIDAGLAALTKKAEGQDLRSLSFTNAQANALVHLTAKGAHSLEMQAQQNPNFLDDLPE